MTDKESRPTRGAWIEIRPAELPWMCWKSRPTRGAWIEITPMIGQRPIAAVAPHKGRVD